MNNTPQVASERIIQQWKVFLIHTSSKCLISSILSKFWWYVFYRQHKPPSSPEQRIFPLLFIATIRQIFCLSPLLLMLIWWCLSFLREYRLITPIFLWDYSHIVPLNQIKVTSETWTSIIPFSGFRSWWCNIRPSLRCPCTVDWQFSRPARLRFPSGASRPNENIRTHRTRVETISVGLPGRRSLSSRVSPSRSFLGSLLRSACYAAYFFKSLFCSLIYLCGAYSTLMW